VDDVPAVLPARAAGGLPVRARDDPLPPAQNAGAAPSRAAGGQPAGPARPAARLLEADRGRGADAGDLMAAAGDDWVAVPAAVHDGAAAASVVRRPSPGGGGAGGSVPVPDVRALQLRLPAGPAVLPDPGGTGADDQAAGAGLVGGLRPIHRPVRRGRLAVAVRRPACRRSRRRRGGARAVAVPGLDRPGRRRLDAAAGRDELPDAECRRHPVPVGAAALAVPADLYRLLRGPRLAVDACLSAAARAGAGGDGLRAVAGIAGGHDGHRRAPPAVLRRAVRACSAMGNWPG